MGNSTIKLRQALDWAVAAGIPNPIQSPSGYGYALVVKLANDVMADLVSQRFNWKWNRAIAPAFETNSYQQDYPMKGITDLGWLQDADRIEINSVAMPKPLKQLTVRRDLSRRSAVMSAPLQLCFYPNDQLSYGDWPGAAVEIHPLIAAQTYQNPILSFVDSNGNYLILTGFGTTGGTEPSATASAAEGTTVADGSCTWTVVGAKSAGFRVDPLPGATGPVYQIIPYYQKKPPTIATIDSLLDPIPDDHQRHFQRGFEAYLMGASPDPGHRAKFETLREDWLISLDRITKNDANEVDAYKMIPAHGVVDDVYSWRRNPSDPGEPY